MIMAKQVDTAVTGTVGDVIFYKWKDKFCIRSKGRTGAQAPIAKENGGYFGKASALSKSFRKMLAPILAEPRSRRLMYRLNNAIYALLRERVHETVMPLQSLPHLSGMSLAEEDQVSNSLTGYLTVERTPDGILQLKVPPFNPAYMSMSDEHPFLHLGVMVVACDMNDPANGHRQYETGFDIPYVDSLFPSRDINQPFQCLPGQLTLVVASLGYKNQQLELLPQAGRRFGGIIGAFWN